MGLSYLVPAGAATAELEVKRSRFRCTVRRAEAEADARAVVEELRREHWDARHHCSAFVLGPPAALGLGTPLERSSDDGEPAGTAGAPMLEVLRGAGVCDVVAVVTRWFGGTLLGAGGLVRAYGDAVRLGLEEAGTLRRVLVREFTVAVPHAAAGRLETDLRAQGVAVLDVTYGAEVVLLLGVEAASAPRLPVLVAGLTGGSAAPVAASERWVDRPA